MCNMARGKQPVRSESTNGCRRHDRDFTDCDQHKTEGLPPRDQKDVVQNEGINVDRWGKGQVYMSPSDPSVNDKTDLLCINGSDCGVNISKNQEKEVPEGAVDGTNTGQAKIEDAEDGTFSDQEALEGAVGGTLPPANITLGTTSGIHEKTSVRPVQRTISLDETKQKGQRPETDSFPHDEDWFKDWYSDMKRYVNDKHESKTSPVTACKRDCKNKGCFSPEKCPERQEYENYKEEIYKYCEERCGAILFQTETGWKHIGTCIHVGEGLLATCYHCVANSLESKVGWFQENRLAELFRLEFPDGSEFGLENRLMYREELHDIVLLKLETEENQLLPLAFKLDFQDCGTSNDERLYVFGIQLDSFELGFAPRAVKPTLEHFEAAQKGVNAHFGSSLEDNTRQFPYAVGEYDLFLFCSLINGASGGAIVSRSPSGRIGLKGIYTSGYPKHIYTKEFTPQQLKDFPQCYKLEKGLKVECIVQAIKNIPFENVSLPSIEYDDSSLDL